MGSTTWYVSQTVGGCESARSPITVTINALPIITISPATAAVCIGKDTTLTASGAVSYTWSPATGLSSTTGAVVKAHPTTTTTYIVTGTATTGCSDTASRVVIVNPLPTPVVPSATICNGSSATLTAGGAMVYTWSPASSLSSSAGISVIASPAITTTYTITGTNSFNCTNTTTATVRVNPVPPKPGVVSPVHYCQYATATALTATGTSLLWYTTSTGGTGSPVAPIPPTATVGSTTWYVSQTVGGCESSRSPVTVNVTHLPAVTLAPAAPAICAGHSVTLSASGAITYNWLPFTGLSTTTGAVVVAGPPVTTSYTVTGTDAVGCSNTDTITVIVHPLPVIKILPANPFICLGSDVILTASGAVAYMWSPSATLSASSGASVIAKPGTTTLYTITGYDLFGCTGSAIDTVNVSPVPPPPAVISPVIYCQNAIASPLSATGLSLLWYTTATGGVGGTVTPVPSTARVDTSTWYVSQTVNGCEGPRDSIKVIVRINAETDFSFKINYGCINDTVSFTNNSKYTYKYLWDFGDNTQDTITNPVHYYHAVTQSTDFKVILFGGNQYCFGDSTKEILTLNPSPGIKLINVTPDQTIPYGSSIPLNADGADTWSWSPDDGTLSALHIHNPVATPKDDNTYIVYGTDLHGCMDSAIIHIFLEYEDSPFVPTAFTPNGDGENDFARILNLRHNKLIDFRIFNRWGQVVFNTTDVNQGWDGKFLGAPQDLGVFVYIFTISDRKGTLRSYKGNITLIR